MRHTGASVATIVFTSWLVPVPTRPFAPQLGTIAHFGAHEAPRLSQKGNRKHAPLIIHYSDFATIIDVLGSGY